MDEIDLLREQATRARRLVVDMAASGVGCHLGGSLSVVDILVAAYAVARSQPGTDVVLSKGHAAAALYAVLHEVGVIEENPAPRYGRAGSPYTGHPGPKVPGVRFPTGSLGHGLAYAVGWALSRRLLNRPGGAIAVVGDGELQEGLVWEALQVAQAKRIGGLTVVVDLNGGQNDGYVSDISPLTDLPARLAAFGFLVTEVDGHDIEKLLTTIVPTDRPIAVLATTVKGKGVPATEGKAGSHYVKISPARARQWKAAIR
ncbi:1-deoxy-D-xylulose-5-phosphate synthase N-terminal domain-containing protein [Micromonospora inaquosa]|uniref:Transketolase n=1 Tax=Micromonospora inaquosa TaxID=2203716 RepID=A0A3N9WEQ8_9ACTN|nr:1-deoxy-D-xylulose-5-phosphate synthase N-terminal domain-containing protein [Micromonospora inaquosa]RQW99403.1 transketolase [Micromonospora inaquosa]